MLTKMSLVSKLFIVVFIQIYLYISRLKWPNDKRRELTGLQKKKEGFFVVDPLILRIFILLLKTI